MGEVSEKGMCGGPSVAVLMATHNGAAYIPDQIRSLLAQSYDNLSLYVRDDGSSDQTVAVLWKTLERSNRRVPFELIEGEHVGLPHGYFYLLQHVSPSHDYYAFADQDDIWAPTKIEHALELLRPLEDGRPLLYFCRQRFVAHDLTPLGYSPLVSNPGLANALVQNPAKGCTQVFNRAALEILREKLPEGVLWHDWWVYLTVAALGTVMFDPRVEIDYRVHKNNTVGEALSGLKKAGRRVERLVRHGGYAARSHAQIFLSIHGRRLDPSRKAFIERFVGPHRTFKERLRYACTTSVSRLDRWENAVLRFLIALDRY